MKTHSARWPTEASVWEVRVAEGIATIAVVLLAVVIVWAAGLGPFRDDKAGLPVKTVESLVVAREGGGSASCYWMNQGEAYGNTQDVYRCRLKGSPTSGFVTACYWVRDVKVIKVTKRKAEYAC
jgi:hypothetical protein